MIVDLCSVKPGDGNGRKETVEKLGARVGQLVEDQRCACVWARIASRPVPADGSSTRSSGVIAAAVRATRPSGNGVENC